MKDLTLQRIADTCGGIAHIWKDSPFPPDTEAVSIVSDSRQVQKGSVFAAIKGERVDGHTFIPSVLEQGALCVLTEQDLDETTRGNWIKVGSTGAALRDIAEEYLKILNIPTIGIVGSVGKTSTKEMVASVLSQKFRTLKTEGNFNNELGVPLTVFRLVPEDEMAVLEMGISDFGEMHRLAKIVRPDTCVMTNIGECHLEFLGDRDGVLKAKSEVFDFLAQGGHIVLNGNDDKLVQIREVNGIKPLFYGLYDDPVRNSGEWPHLDVYADQICSLGIEGSRCTIHTPDSSFEATVPMPGRHMIMNALAAAAAGYIYGLSPDQISRGIESMQTVKGRFHIIRTGSLIVIDDCYNANPISMAASIRILKDVPGRRAAILGDMAELGEMEQHYHRQMGQLAADEGIDVLCCVGPRGQWIAEAAKEAASGKEIPAVYSWLSTEECLKELSGILRKDDTVLVKASHCMEFEKIVKWLEGFTPEKQ